MSDDDALPEFGERAPGVPPTERPGAYGIALDRARRRVAVMRTPLGDFLPGGGSGDGETELETLRREVLEECGRDVEIGRRLGAAMEYVIAERGGSFAKRCAFYEIRLGERLPGPTEPDHALAWVPIDEALAGLAHGSQRWALRVAVQP
ncbi:MAG: NUDIX domain-containing protein [Planctomycetota bacterium]